MSELPSAPCTLLWVTPPSSFQHPGAVVDPVSSSHLSPQLVSLLCVKAYHGHHHALEVLVQSLVDLDVRNSQGRTPLDLAAFKGHVECVDVLINQGASILVKDFTLKRTPIHAAATNGHSECLHLLIGNADLQSAVDIQDGNGQWVSHILSVRALWNELHCWLTFRFLSGPPWCWRFWAVTQTACIRYSIKEPVWKPKTSGAGQPCTES